MLTKAVDGACIERLGALRAHMLVEDLQTIAHI